MYKKQKILREWIQYEVMKLNMVLLSIVFYGVKDLSDLFGAVLKR